MQIFTYKIVSFIPAEGEINLYKVETVKFSYFMLQYKSVWDKNMCS